MNPSVIEPISPAIEHTKRVLFDPFDFGKWLRLGFCAFLMGLGEGGGGGSSGGQATARFGHAESEPVLQWVRENVPLVVAIVVGVVLVGFLIGLLVTWLSSRGHFMFLDGVVRNRGSVVEPWREYRREGNSFFLFRVCLGLIGFAVVLVILALCGAIAWPAIQGEAPDAIILVAVLLAVVLFVPFALVMGFIGTLLGDFVKPIMYLRRISVREAWREFYDGMFAGRAGTFVLYFLFKILIGMAVGAMAMAVVCMTCCIVVIPYVGSVILLPLLVFLQAYPLYFIQQFGPKWQIIPITPQKPI